MTTVADLISDTEQHLFTGQGEELNEVLVGFTSATSPARTTISMREAVGSLAVGARLAIGLEVFRVWSFDEAAKTVTVVGQIGGSPASTHAEGDLVTIEPKFPAYRTLRALQQEVASLGVPSLGMWRPATLDLTSTTPAVGYDLAGAIDADIINIHRVQSRPTDQSAQNDWRDVPGWRFQRGLPSASFSSGMAVFIPQGNLPTGSPVRVIMRCRFGPLGTSLTADVEAVTGLIESAHDILSLGAALRLYSPREFKRGFTEAQPEPRRWEEVPATAQSTASSSMRQVYRQRITEHASYLSTLYPSRPY